MEDFSGKESAFGFGVNSQKTMNSVQKCSKIRNFCTEFPYFASIAKIEPAHITKSHIFVFFRQYWRFKYKQNSTIELKITFSTKFIILKFFQETSRPRWG